MLTCLKGVRNVENVEGGIEHVENVEKGVEHVEKGVEHVEQVGNFKKALEMP